MSIRSLYDYVRNFLFSNVNKQFVVFLFFLFLSGIFWLIMTLNETYEREIKIPLRMTAIPKNVVLTSAPTDTIRATIRDKGWVILNYLYGNRLKTIGATFRNYDRGNGGGIISTADLRRMVEQQMEISSKVISIKPEKLEFFYNNGERKRVPVRWAGRVIPEQLFFISEVEYLPDSVDVYASADKLDSIRAIYTEPLNYVNFRDSLSIDCRLSHRSDVKVVPENVHINFHTDVLTEEKMTGIPIVCLNLPPDKVLRTFPSKATVHFVAGVSHIRSLHPEDFLVVADYNEIAEKKTDKCTIYLRKTPTGISRATLETKQVDYLIEEE